MTAAAFGASYTAYLFDMLRTLAALAGVCVLAWIGLRALARRGFGAAPPGAPVRVVARIALDAHSSVHVVRAGSRVLLLGVARGAAPRLIAELDAELFDGASARAPSDGEP